MGGPAEQAPGAQAARLARIPHANLCGRFNLAGLVRFLSELDLLVTPDTGPMHVGAWGGTLTLNLSMGPVNAWETAPFPPGHLVLRPTASCVGCWTCVRGPEPPCRERFTPGRVAALIHSLLKPGHTPPTPPGLGLLRTGRSGQGLFDLAPAFPRPASGPETEARPRDSLGEFWRQWFLRRLGGPADTLPEALARLDESHPLGGASLRNALTLWQARLAAELRRGVPAGDWWRQAPPLLRPLSGYLQLSLENDDYSRQARLAALEHAGSGFPADYHKFYKGSEIVRCRRKGYSYTIINHSAGFLYFQNGDFTVSMHIGASFCEHRSFIPETLASTGENAYALHQTMTGWYYLPFEEKPETSDWWKMDHTKRAQLHGPDMIFDVEVTEAENGIDVHIVNTGIDRAPLRVELAFDAGCRVETEHFAADGAEGGGIVAKSGTLTASRGRYAIEAGPCFGAHGFTAGKFGSMKRTEGCYTVYLTDYSCFEHTISLRAKPSIHD